MISNKIVVNKKVVYLIEIYFHLRSFVQLENFEFQKFECFKQNYGIVNCFK
jgi:hypothetical protein